MYSCIEIDDDNCSAMKRFGLGSIRCLRFNELTTVYRKKSTYEIFMRIFNYFT